MRWIVFLGIALFVGGVIYTSTARVQHQCEVCLEFDGDVVCRRGAGETEDAARMAAQESACGGNVNGMSEIIACRAQEPVSLQCSLS